MATVGVKGLIKLIVKSHCDRLCRPCSIDCCNFRVDDRSSRNPDLSAVFFLETTSFVFSTFFVATLGRLLSSSCATAVQLKSNYFYQRCCAFYRSPAREATQRRDIDIALVRLSVCLFVTCRKGLCLNVSSIFSLPGSGFSAKLNNIENSEELITMKINCTLLSLNPAVFEIIGSKRIEVTSLTFRPFDLSVTSSVA